MDARSAIAGAATPCAATSAPAPSARSTSAAAGDRRRSGNNDGITWLQFDVLMQALALEHGLVVERHPDVASGVATQEHDVLAGDELLEAAGAGNQLQDRHRSAERIGPGLVDVTGDEDDAAVNLAHDDRRRRVFEEPRRSFGKSDAELLRRHPRRLHIVEER